MDDMLWINFVHTVLRVEVRHSFIECFRKVQGVNLDRLVARSKASGENSTFAAVAEGPSKSFKVGTSQLHQSDSVRVIYDYRILVSNTLSLRPGMVLGHGIGTPHHI